MGIFDGSGKDQYTVKDLVYYAGFFAGTIAGYLIAQSLGAPPIACLIAGVVTGVALGWGSETAYTKSRRPPQPPENQDKIS